jgi:hypothetical protein
MSQIRDSPVFTSPRNRVAQLYPQALGSRFVASYDSQGYSGGIPTRLHNDKVSGLLSADPRYTGSARSARKHGIQQSLNCCGFLWRHSSCSEQICHNIERHGPVVRSSCPCAIKTYGGVVLQIHKAQMPLRGRSCWTTVLQMWRLHRKINPSSRRRGYPPPPVFIGYWIGGSVGPRAGLDAVEKRNAYFPCRESNPGHPTSSYTD